ncbi:MAG TPA: YkgJ family cysteine cluster protein [Oligoflexus sp.]|uniref:YkgJ family cysteine cluster protein n=1 Tax=Oligoflexus sp. TaxID=1971216 RepID=UPI002D73B24A|nr:YkgJ family cysteine cluster protein [Oligoflexus sp.]HYX34222.1 YkgJ family cysteine cluster protein [Oligoflexus sp.]
MSSRSRKPKKADAKPKTVDFNLTPQGFLIKSSGQQGSVEFFDKKFSDYQHQMKTMDPDYAYATAINKIKVVLDEISLNNRRPISCRAGCSACCHSKVDIVPWEAELIKQHVAENNIRFDTRLLDIQSEALKGEPGTYEKLPFADRRCIFLDADQKCSIYSVRPLMCRRHFVQSDPSFCKTEEFARIEIDVNPDVDAYLSAYVTHNATVPLPAFIQEQQASFNSHTELADKAN